MKEIIIRPATDSDSELITTLIFGIWINEYGFVVKKVDYPDLLEIDRYYTKTKGAFFVACHANDIVGTIACESLDENNFVLKRMFVHRDFRGVGIAQKLLDSLLEKSSGISKDKKISFFLSTKEPEALAAKSFYLKNGFKIIARKALPDKFPYFYEDNLFMVKKL